jgi:hypothetical protein
VGTDVVKTGSDTLFSAIAQLHPGIQISMVLMLGVMAALAWFAMRVLSDLKAEREQHLQAAERQREAGEKMAVALALAGERYQQLAASLDRLAATVERRP